MTGESRRKNAASGCMLGVKPDNFSASACNILLKLIFYTGIETWMRMRNADQSLNLTTSLYIVLTDLYKHAHTHMQMHTQTHANTHEHAHTDAHKHSDTYTQTHAGCRLLLPWCHGNHLIRPEGQTTLAAF